MRIGVAFGWAISAGFLIAACGSSSSDGGSTASVCTPGASAACTGAGGCSGGYICNESGTAFGDCDCGNAPDASSPTDASPITDASSVIESGVDAGPWTPLNLAGLELWTEGSNRGDSGASVHDWPDQSTHALDLVGVVGNPATDSAAINGLDALLFSGTTGMQMQTAAAADFGWGTDAFVVETVLKPGACTAECSVWTIFSTAQTDGFSVNVFNGNVVAASQGSGGTSVNNAAITAGAHVVGLRRVSATSAEIRIDGTATAFTFSSGYSPSGATYAVSLGYGAAATASAGPFQGDMAEVVIAHNPSDADVTQLESYLKTKYGL